uniref:Uncharacterized protein n=1 Tax=Megaselia scalaris TaxID=36166 RepID=T1GN69_MEGSC
MFCCPESSVIFKIFGLVLRKEVFTYEPISDDHQCTGDPYNICGGPSRKQPLCGAILATDGFIVGLQAGVVNFFKCLL